MEKHKTIIASYFASSNRTSSQMVKFYGHRAVRQGQLRVAAIIPIIGTIEGFAAVAATQY